MNYNDLVGLPLMNGVTIIGDKTFEDYGLVPMSSEDIANLMLEVFGYLL
jgi:hypothetical protein